MSRILSPSFCPHPVVEVDSINAMREAVTSCLICGATLVISDEDVSNYWKNYEYHSPRGPEADSTILIRRDA